MIRGILPFYCSECSNRFMGVAAEWYATAFVSPIKCPKCGDWHTRPWSIMPAKIANLRYKNIWEFYDRNKPNE